MRAVAYLRVSTDEQAQSGAGLRAQEDACRAHAVRAGAELVGPSLDAGVSGAAPLDARPGLVEAFARVGPGDALLVAKRDRLGRDPIIVAMIEAAVAKRGGRVASAAGEGTDGDDPSSVLMRRIVDAFAEHEQLILKAYTRAALLAKRRGQRTGSVPYGSELVDDGRRSKTDRPVALVPSVAELAAVLHQLVATGRAVAHTEFTAVGEFQGVRAKLVGPCNAGKGRTRQALIHVAIGRDRPPLTNWHRARTQRRPRQPSPRPAPSPRSAPSPRNVEGATLTRDAHAGLSGYPRGVSRR